MPFSELPRPENAEAQAAREVRANIAFEHMLYAAIIGGGVSAAAALSLRVGALVVAGASDAISYFEAVVGSIFFGVVVFLIAFASAVAVFTPIYVLIEKSRMRKIWPFHIAAFAVQYVVLAALGEAPSFDSPARFLYLLPGALIVFLFGRRILPLWRAADLAAAQAGPSLRLVH